MMLFPVKKSIKKLLPQTLKKKLAFRISPIFANKRIRDCNGKPEFVLIESTNHCNAKCIMCPNVDMKRKKGVMTFDLYKHIIDECVTLGIERIKISGTGEPLLDPLLFEKIRYARESGIKEIMMFTNASILNKKKQEELLSSGLDLICLSIDGFTKETYEKVRVGLSFEKVKENTLSFLEMKKRKGLKKPYIMVTGLYLSDEMLTTMNTDFYKKIKEHSDLVTINLQDELHDWAGGIDTFNSKSFSKHNQPCRRLWSSVFILWDGRVCLCCIDYEGVVNLGDVSKQSILKIYNSQKFNELRNYHQKGEFGKISLCKNCFERPSWINKKSERLLSIFEP